MAVLANQRELVRRPGSLTPRYGLFDVVRAMGGLSDALPIHARQGGLQYETSVCGLPTCFETNCIDALGTKPAGSTYTIVNGNPFIALTSLACGSVGMTDAILRDKLREKALAGEQALVEATFSTGDCGAAPSLANNTPAATSLGAAANLIEAFSDLEAAFYATYGLPGVIHVPLAAMPYVVREMLIYQDGARVWRTPTGSYVSVGNYAGTSPVGVAPAAGTTWIYITGQVDIWRTPESDVFYTPLQAALDRSTNQVNGFREREYIVTFECLSFASNPTLVAA